MKILYFTDAESRVVQGTLVEKRTELGLEEFLLGRHLLKPLLDIVILLRRLE